MSRTRRFGSSLLGVATLLALVLAAAPAARGQSAGVDVQMFRPNPHSLGTFSVDSARTLGHLDWTLGFYVNYANDPLRLVRANDADETLWRYVTDQGTADILFAIGLFDIVDVGIDLPVTFYLDGEGLPDSGGLQGSGLGDLRVVPRIAFLDTGMVSFGFALDLFFPTGDDDAFLATGGFRAQPRLNLGLDFEYVKFFVNLGVRLQEEASFSDLDLGQELFYGLGVAVPFKFAGDAHRLEVIGELTGYTRIDNPFQEANETGMELRGGLRYHTPIGLAVTLGAGGGVLPGYGTPDWRVLGALQYDVGPSGPCCIEECPDPDRDCDRLCDPWVGDKGLAQADIPRCAGHGACKEAGIDGDPGVCPLVCTPNDECPLLPEDYDGFEDTDGCPEPDNDNDKICDPWVARDGMAGKYAGRCRLSDACPMDAEDVDGFEDDDGCPDPDNDCDRVCDPWVTDAHQLDGTKYRACGPNEGTCPAKGLDASAECGETVCRTKEGARTLPDQCVSVPENYNLNEDDDGCPEVICGKITLPEKIQFERGSDVIKPESYDVLDMLANILRETPGIRRLLVEGHTSDEWGNRPWSGWDKNLDLSRRRAASVVRYLVAKGIARERLTSEGYAWQFVVQPKGRTAREWREASRRTMFIILEQDETEGCPDSGTRKEPRKVVKPRQVPPDGLWSPRVD